MTFIPYIPGLHCKKSNEIYTVNNIIIHPIKSIFNNDTTVGIAFSKTNLYNLSDIQYITDFIFIEYGAVTTQDISKLSSILVDDNVYPIIKTNKIKLEKAFNNPIVSFIHNDFFNFNIPLTHFSTIKNVYIEDLNTYLCPICSSKLEKINSEVHCLNEFCGIENVSQSIRFLNIFKRMGYFQKLGPIKFEKILNELKLNDFSEFLSLTDSKFVTSSLYSNDIVDDIIKIKNTAFPEFIILEGMINLPYFNEAHSKKILSMHSLEKLLYFPCFDSEKINTIANKCKQNKNIYYKLKKKIKLVKFKRG